MVIPEHVESLEGLLVHLDGGRWRFDEQFRERLVRAVAMFSPTAPKALLKQFEEINRPCPSGAYAAYQRPAGEFLKDFDNIIFKMYIFRLVTSAGAS